MDQQEKRYVNEREASRILGLAVQTLRNYRFQRRGPRFARLGERAIRYDVQDLLEYAEARKIKTQEV
jgi:predicted DNA-binding transcriptional regulator AlpA